MNVEIDNPFIEMLKVQLNELETGKISQDLYIAQAENTIRHLERWLEEISRLALTKLLHDTTPIKSEPKNSNFDTKQEKING